jgi:rod shape-determining protein MreB
MEREVTYIGMDLGSYKTSVASSTGARDVILSAVGWPRDHVARTLLNSDVVFGNIITEHRLALHVVRPFEKGALKYNDQATAAMAAEQVALHKEAARLLVQHAVGLTKPPLGAPIYGVIGAPSRATIQNKKVVFDAAREAFDEVLIVSEPFTIAFGMNRLSDTLVIDIGAGTIDICPIMGTFPREEDQVTVPLGGDFIDETFLQLMAEEHPQVRLSINMAREIKEKFGYVHDAREQALVPLPVDGKPKAVDVAEPLRIACRTIVPPIIQGLRELIGRFDPEFQHTLLQNIILGGGGSQLRGLDRVIEESLQEYGGAKVKRVGDAVHAGSVGALKLAMGMPPECWEELHAGQPEMRAAA